MVLTTFVLAFTVTMFAIQCENSFKSISGFLFPSRELIKSTFPSPVEPAVSSAVPECLFNVLHFKYRGAILSFIRADVAVSQAYIFSSSVDGMTCVPFRITTHFQHEHLGVSNIFIFYSTFRFITIISTAEPSTPGDRFTKRINF